MVYIGIRSDGEVVHHTSLKALKELDGVEAPVREVPDEEFESAGCLARLIDGEIVIGKTEPEKTVEQNQKRIAEIDAELQTIDLKSGRSSVRSFPSIGITSST